MDRIILHSDMNNYYAAVECLYNPALRNKPMAVGGDPEHRHGIVLAKNYIAKRYGVKTGETLWQAMRKCPDIVFVPPRFDRYLKFSELARNIYSDYTDRVEPFGLDESWLDVTGSNGKAVADEIRERIKCELGVTVSIGVSFNKIFAKLGSDMQKPDATTVIERDSYKALVWPLDVAELLFVGRATTKALRSRGIFSIGDLAACPPDNLKRWFGKNGLTLWRFANGYDDSPVAKLGDAPPIKSVGNSTTTPRDLVCTDDIKIVLRVLSDSVAARLRQHGLYCDTVQISVRHSDLEHFERQRMTDTPTCVSDTISSIASKLFAENVQEPFKIRSLGVRACGLSAAGPQQLSFLPEQSRQHKLEDLERTVDWLRGRFGYYSIQPGILLTDRSLSALNPKEDHIIHPVGYKL